MGESRGRSAYERIQSPLPPVDRALPPPSGLSVHDSISSREDDAGDDAEPPYSDSGAALRHAPGG